MIQTNSNDLRTAKGIISLLWPKESIENKEPTVVRQIDATACRDIELEHLVQGFKPHGKEMTQWIRLLGSLCADERVIRHRQQVFSDIYEHPVLAELLEDLLPELQALSYSRTPKSKENDLVFSVTQRLAELEGLAAIVSSLLGFFKNEHETIKSRAFLDLFDELQNIESDPHFRQMMSEVPELLVQLRNVSSVTIGVNLNHHLQPVQATLLSVNKERFNGQSTNLLNRLMGKTASEFEGIAQLHSVPQKMIQFNGQTVKLDSDTHGYAVNPMMVPLFKDLNEVLKKTLAPIDHALRKYGRISSNRISAISEEIPFFLGGLRMLKGFVKAGLPVCCPKILAAEQRISRMKSAYNPNLALALLIQGKEGKLSSPIVLNDVDMSQNSRVQIITGPNQGGKTTYIQAIAHSHILFQAGFFVPATEAEMSPVDCLCTHFPTEEKIDRGRGRLGDEAHRFSRLFEMVTANSLFLLNESFSSTYSGESLYMAQDILRILLKLGTRTLFATHLHELAARYEDLNRASDYPDRCVSLVSRVSESGEKRRTYQIVPSQPLGHSYAKEIAEKFGIAYDQLKDSLKARGVF
ncbi:MAG: hypothetical protein JXR70_13665 [Spirochaetales bacterium]|nr:hypothetical protein [Spirochaetales bacterium]